MPSIESKTAVVAPIVAEHAPPPPVADHTLVRCISREGAYGEVWLARSVMGTYRAVKIVRRSKFQADGPYDTEFEGLRTFHDVSREHPGFVDILHVSRNDEQRYFYYVMELADDLPGHTERQEARRFDPDTYVPATLKTLLDQRRHLAPTECVEIALDICDAVVDLHKRRLVHRDLKPSNIIFVKGRARLGDIGLVGEVIDAPLPAIGTPGYMDDELHGTARGDLYSLGKIIYVMATGMPAEQWPAWPARSQDLPKDIAGLRELNEVFVRACHPDRARGYATAEELRADLLLLKAGSSVRRLVRLDKLLTAAKRYGLAALLITVLGVVVLWQQTQRRKQAEELLQRQVGSAIAYGTRALEDNDLLGSLPWFAEALRLDAGQPVRERTHRLRLGSVLRRAPHLEQMWFQSPQLPWAEFAVNGTQLLAAGTNHLWNVWDIASGQPRFAFFGQSAAGEVAHLSPDGTRAVTRSDRFPPGIWDVATGRLLFTLPWSNYVSDVAFSPDGLRLVTAGAKGDVVLWDALTGMKLSARKHGTKYVMRAAFSPDGARLATGDSAGTLCLWDLSQDPAQTPKLLQIHTSWIYRVAYSRDGQWVATASTDRDVRVCHAATGEPLNTPLRHADVVASLNFSPDGRWLAVAGWDFAAHVWDFKAGQRQLVLPHNSKVMHVAFSPDGRQLMTVANDGIIRFWNPRLDEPALTPQSLAVSEDGLCLARFHSDRIEFLDARSDQTLGTLPMPGRTPANTMLSRDGSRIAVLETATNTGREVRLWSRDHSAAVGPALPLDAALTNLALAPTGARLAAFAGARLVTVDLETGRNLATIEAPSGQRIRRAVFDPGGQRLALVLGRTVGRTLQVFDAATGQSLTPPIGHPMPIEHLEFSRDGRLVLAACMDGSVDPGAAHAWDATTGQLAGPALTHRDGVLSAVFDETGRRVVTCGEDNVAVVWDVSSGRRLTSGLRHGWQVRCAAWSLDGRWIATGCRDGAVRVWNALTGEPLTPPWRLSGEVMRVQFAGADRLLAGTKAGETFLISLPSETRSAAELELLAQLMSAQHLFRPGGATLPQSREGLEEVWQRLQSAKRDAARKSPPASSLF